MVDIQSIAAVIFIVLLSLILYKERKRIIVQKLIFPVLYFVMYKTKVGLNLMDSWSKKYKKLIHILSIIGIYIGFLGMILITLLLFKNLYDVFTKPLAISGVALVLPFKVKGAVFVPFFYWIISIFVLAVVHEFSHGVVARLFKIKIKSSGFAALAIFLPILPAAFVEPDEKQVAKIPKKQQLAIFAAGPFSNILTAIIIIILFLTALQPITNAIMIDDGVKIISVNNESSPAFDAGIIDNELIINIDNSQINSVDDFKEALDEKSPNQEITLQTNVSTYPVTLGTSPQDNEKAYLGVSVVQNFQKNEAFIAKYGSFTTESILWILGLLYWLYVLNLGIGLFNLVPLGPIDGGRMLLTGLECITTPERAKNIWKNISWLFLILIILNIGIAFI
tara:strand:- start:799 stop:1977 length:1179 start_codon:yes stop_codon:yes gene_type:complete